MRIIGSVAASFLILSLLAGCQSEEAKRQAAVNEGIDICVQGLANTGAMANGMDPQRICRCTLDKLAEGKNVEQIRQIAEQKSPSSADLEAMGSCVIQEVQKQGLVGK